MVNQQEVCMSRVEELQVQRELKEIILGTWPSAAGLSSMSARKNTDKR